LVLPGCEAWIVHVPTLTSVTVALATVQTVRVVEAKLTARAEDAAALTVNGAVPSVLLVRAVNVMVWLPGVIVKLWSTGAAGA